MLGLLSGIGGILGGLGSLGGFGLGLYGALNEPETPENETLRSWAEGEPDRLALIESQLPMPMLYGADLPASIYNTKFGYGPSAGTQTLYNNLLSGNYGYSPQELGFMRQNVLSPLAYGGPIGITPAAIERDLLPDADMLVQSLANINQIGMADQQSYLQNAANIATFNANRAKWLGSVVG